MTETTIAYMNGEEVLPLETLVPNQEHDHDTPVLVSENNIAKVNVSAEEHELEPYKEQYIKEKRKHVVLKGFRKGNAPEKMVARYFKEEARQSARNNVLYIKFIKLLQEHKLQALSEPKLDHIHDENGKIVAGFIVDVLQPVVLGQYLGLEIEKMSSGTIDENIKKTLSEIKKSYPKLLNTDGTVERGNVVVADFIVMDGNKELEKQIDFRINIGANLYFQPFEDHIIGMTIGENKEFDIHFPETYHKDDFKAKTIHFNLTVKEVKTISEYDNNELAKVLGYDNEDKMIEVLTCEIELKHKDDEHLFYENQLLGQLLSDHPFKIPDKLINDEINKIHVEHPEMPVNQVEEVANRFVRTDLILHAIYERHPEIHLNQDQFNTKMAELAAKANDSVENTIQKLQAAGKLQTYMSYLSNCKVIDFLIEMSDKKEPAQTAVITENKVEEKDNG